MNPNSIDNPSASSACMTYADSHPTDPCTSIPDQTPQNRTAPASTAVAVEMSWAYDKFPCLHISSGESSGNGSGKDHSDHIGSSDSGINSIHVLDSNVSIWKDPDSITARLKAAMAAKSEGILVFDFYHGVDIEWLIQNILNALPATTLENVEEARRSEEEMKPVIEPWITDDRVFGVLSPLCIADYYDPQKVQKFKARIRQKPGWKIVYGPGAAHVIPRKEADLLVYADLSRWEIQQRYRSGRLDNWNAGNFHDDPLRMFKRGYFLEWRVFDRHKHNIFNAVDYFLDTIIPDQPVMVDQKLMQNALDIFAASPFRLVPYFDEGIWGGRWMEKVCGLKRKEHNFAWCFDGVPEENSIAFEIDGIRFEMPAMNLVQERPEELLGPHVYEQFGAEFPIRFDFLDTMDGGNLSLQVHPLKSFIHEHFHMPYTQDESYYILDAAENACVYLGVKSGVQEQDLIPALKAASQNGCFEAERYINRFPARRHDHFLIPAGTIHCSGQNAMVLEISATPYIFTFKLWDWGRLGLDGKPRPINVERGAPNIQYDRDTEWCRNNLVSPTILLEKGEGYWVEKTGLHKLEPIETRRITFHAPYLQKARNTVMMLNLVEGEAVEVSSPAHAFAPLIVHYAETWIIPADAGDCLFTPLAGNSPKARAEAKVIQAYIRPDWMNS